MRILAGALTCAMLAACAGSTTGGAGTAGESGTRHSWTQPHRLRIGLQTSPNTLNPLLAANTTEAMIARLLCDVLVTVDERGNHVPMLAETVPTQENGGISRDGLTITYHLRHGVRWHDGVAFTSKDVAYSWRAIMDKRNNVIAQTGYNLVRSVDTPDDFTVIFHMKTVFSPAIDTIFGESDTPYAIVPAHLLASSPSINSVPYNSAPIGTGPFKFKEWARGDHITLVRNDDYFLGKPKLEEITLKMIPDENTEINQLRTHDLDWQFEASPETYGALKALPEIRTVLQERNEYDRIQINARHAPLDDIRVRRAIAYAIDLPRLTRDLTFDSATAADQDLPPFMWAHAQNVTRYPHDPAKASALLKQAGFTPGPDGVLVRNGQRLAIELATNSSNATRRAAVVQVQAMLAAVGIHVDVKTYLGSQLFAAMGQNGILTNGRYDLAWTAWVSGVDPDQSSMFLCSAQPPNGNNESGYCSKEVDAAEQDALGHFDRGRRKKDYAIIEAAVTRDLPLMATWWPRQAQPINPDFKNFKPNAVTASWNSQTWDI